MKNIIPAFVIIALICISSMLNAQTTVWSLDFESTGGYTTSVAEFTDGASDYFTRTDGTNIASTNVYYNIQGSYFFGAQDTDGDGGPTNLTITIDDVSIATYSNLIFKLLIAEDDAADGNQDWDADSYLHISYDINNSGTFTNLIWVEAAYTENGFNGEPKIDTDFDGLGDGTAITSTFTEFSANIAGTGNTIDIKIEINMLNDGDEDIAIDSLILISQEGPLPLDANFGADQTTILQGETVNFSDLTSGGTPPYTYAWDLDGDAQFDDSSNPNPSFQYNTPGTYTVALQVTDNAARATDTETKTDYITVEALTSVSTVSALRAGTLGENYTLTGEVLLTFQQSYRNQKFVQDATGGILIDDNSGTITTSYNVMDGITGLTGTLGEYQGMLQFVPLQDPGTATSTGNILIPQVITLSQLSASFEDYESELVQIQDVSFSDATAFFTNGTAYSVSDVSRATGEFYTSFYDVDYIDLTIPTQADVVGIPTSRGDTPVNYFTARNLADFSDIALTANFIADQYAVTVGTTVNFSDTTIGGVQPYLWQWDLDGDGEYDDSGDPDPSYQYNSAGTYTVALRVWDDNSAISTKTRDIEVISDQANVIINEVDSDTPSTDVLEFIELYDGGIGNSNLNGLVVVLYNGSTNLSYAAFDLDGYSTDANGYFLLGNSAVVPTPAIIFTNGILQNGQDAVAVYIGDATSFPTGTALTTSQLMDALVYDTSDPDDPELLVLLNSGQPQVNENGRGSGDLHSNQRFPNGSGGERNTETYDQAPPTPGAANTSLYIEWTGVTSSDWNTGSNWLGDAVPGSTITVTVPAGTPNDPVVSGAAVCKDLFILDGATVTVNPGGSITIGTATPGNNPEEKIIYIQEEE